MIHYKSKKRYNSVYYGIKSFKYFENKKYLKKE